MHELITWVVVANSARARVFQLMKGHKMVEMTSLIHPESRFHNQDLISSAPGRTFQSGGPTRHAYQEKVNHKELESDHFAKTVAQHLSLSFQEGKFSRLYLMANPGFLGLLRQHIDPQIKEVIVAETNRDVTEQSTSEIEKQLSKF